MKTRGDEAATKKQAPPYFIACRQRGQRSAMIACHDGASKTRFPTSSMQGEHTSHRSRGRSTSRSGSRERRGKHHREYSSHRGRWRSASRSESRERRGKHQSRRRSRSRSESRERRGKHQRERGVNHRTSQRGSAVDNFDDEQQMASLLPSDLYAAINDDGGTISTGPSSVAEVFQRPFPRQEELAWIFAEQRRRRLFDGSMCVRMCTACHTHLHAIRMHPCTGA